MIGKTIIHLPYLLLAALCAALFFAGLGSIPLIGLDEGLYAGCAREMLASGNYVVPTHGGEPFFDKPPLCYWLQAASMRFAGVNSLGARLPSAVGAVMLVALTVLLGSRLHTRRAGLFAGFALACSIMTTGLARMCVLDMVFALTITAALGAFLLAHLGLARRWWFLGFWAAMGLSVMVKGPVGAVLVLGTAAAFLLLRRRGGEVARTMPLPGVVVLLLVVAPWYAMVQAQTDGAFLREFVVHQNVQRALGADFEHNMPFYFYLPIFLVGFFPWSIFLPLAWANTVTLRPRGCEAEASLFAAVWVVVVVGVFSIFRSKLPAYTYPAYPAAALLVGVMWARAAEAGKLARLRLYAAAACAAAVLVAVALQVARRYLETPIPGLDPVLLVMSVSLAAGPGAALILLGRGRFTGAYASLCAGMAAFLLAASLLGLPVASRTLTGPAVEAARAIRRLTSPSDAIYAYRLSPPQPAISFYSQRNVPMRHTQAEIGRSIAACRRSLVIVQRERLRELPKGGRFVLKTGPYLIYGYGRR